MTSKASSESTKDTPAEDELLVRPLTPEEIEDLRREMREAFDQMNRLRVAQGRKPVRRAK